MSSRPPRALFCASTQVSNSATGTESKVIGGNAMQGTERQWGLHKASYIVTDLRVYALESFYSRIS